MNKYIELSKEVQEAINNKKPIVALESTIISHGMPYPQNMEMAKKCEDIVRSYGAVPATICLMNGKLKVGINEEELEVLATSKDVIKTSKKDLAFVIANNKIGATTVATTMYISHLAGIEVFATGGIGGVHRNAEITMDISADLDELANTSVAVVCAGIKSILDLEKTMEYLETRGVDVLGYQTSILPEFYTFGKDIKVNYKVDSPLEIAKMLNIKNNLNLKSGSIIANPIPKEYAMDYNEINDAINIAIANMEKDGISGYESTPYLLGAIKDITKGKSLESNIALVYNNVNLASQIAVELNKLK